MISGLPADEQRRLLEKRRKQTVFQTPVHAQFEAQAQRTPGAIAVVSGERRLTYAQLDARAGHLAHRLRALGVGLESLVGLHAERSVDLVVGLLGIFKAGAAYVPLDPAYPEQRLTTMMRDSGLAVLVTEAGLRGKPAAADIAVVTLESLEDSPSPDGGPPNLNRRGSLDNLAYVIYTSGSTGKPKGVSITHRALANFLGSMQSLFRMSDRDTVLSVTTLSFDIAALEIFLPLIQGARVDIAARQFSGDGPWLAKRLDLGDITLMQATPSTWRMLLDSGWQGAPEMRILCGGEALPRDLADRLLDKGKALWNLYGPTETTIWSSAGRVEAGESAITIGGPINATRLYTLDSRLQLVPQGVAGELYIAGDGVARGYLKRPALTAERFLPDPFSRIPGSRMYRTGDSVRARAGGQLECLGRVDHQVKIRGHRIEPGEIEIALRRHPDVREAVVAAREGRDGVNQLAAYIVPQEGRKPRNPDLRGLLLETLPEYMVPSTYTTLAALPLTPNGKVDRRALPDPAELPAAYTPPRGPIEEGIAQVWGELLGRARISIEDNFFDVGGHSLLATQILARVREMYGVELTLRQLFDRPTVAGMAQLVERQMREGVGSHVPPITPVARGGVAPASFAQQRLWFLDQLEPDSSVYNMPVSVRLEGDLDEDSLARALNEIIRRHEVLRTSFSEANGRPQQNIAQDLRIELPVIDLLMLPEEEREREARRLIAQEARRPFDLTTGPLIRAILVCLEDRQHVVLVTVHHIVADAWSLGVMVREASILYDAFTNARPSPLPEPAIQYADYASWQVEWLSGGVMQTQLAYWTEELHGVPVLELPTDRPRPAALSGSGGERSLNLPAELIGKLKTLGRQENVTFYMTLMAAFQVLLHRYSGQDDFAVGTPIAGRTRSEIEGLIGLFVNTLAIRARFSGNPDFLTVLRRVRQASLGAYANQDLPFDQLVAVLQPRRDPARSPIFQALFALQNAPMPAFESGVLSMTPMESKNGTAKFDLALFAAEAESGLHLAIEYSSDLFDPDTADCLLNHFQILLEGIAADPDRPIGSLPLLSEAERGNLLGSGADPLPDLDELTDDEVDELLSRFESRPYVQD